MGDASRTSHTCRYRASSSVQLGGLPSTYRATTWYTTRAAMVARRGCDDLLELFEQGSHLRETPASGYR